MGALGSEARIKSYLERYEQSENTSDMPSVQHHVKSSSISVRITLPLQSHRNTCYDCSPTPQLLERSRVVDLILLIDCSFRSPRVIDVPLKM